MRHRAIVTVGVSSSRGFGVYHERFRKTIAESGFACADTVIQWEKDWPPDSPTHANVHYAFKLYAIKEAMRRGYTSILYLDCCAYAVASLEPLWKKIESDGHMLAGEIPNDIRKDNYDRLGTWCSDFCLDEFSVDRESAMFMPLLSGTCMGLDVTNAAGLNFYMRLMQYAVPEHFNGTYAFGESNSNKRGLVINPKAETEGQRVSKDPRVQGHRSDEAYMTLIAQELGMKSTGEFFTGGMAPKISTIIRSGYTEGEDLNPNYTVPKAKLKVVGEHTVNTALLTKGGLVVDAGCRDFTFSKGLAKLGCKVLAFDPDPTVEDPKAAGVNFQRLALVAPGGPSEIEFVMSRDPQARHIAAVGDEPGTERVKIKTTTLADILGKSTKIGFFDVVKLDIEGAEYNILLRWPGPIAKQISIEFHEHVRPRPEEMYEQIFAHLGQWYDVVQHEKERRHGCHPNYWDTLLQLKDSWLGWGAY